MNCVAMAFDQETRLDFYIVLKLELAIADFALHAGWQLLPKYLLRPVRRLFHDIESF